MKPQRTKGQQVKKKKLYFRNVMLFSERLPFVFTATIRIVFYYNELDLMFTSQLQMLNQSKNILLYTVFPFMN